jgi:uncharacterized protein (TIGR04255 family)
VPDIYANAPLAQAICQARFPGELAVEVARPKIQGVVRSALPKLYVPIATPGEAPAMQPYVFKSRDESETLAVAVNSFAFTTTKYAGYAEFRENVLRYVGVFSTAVPEVDTLNRLGLRYINRMPILRESKLAALPLRDYLNVSLQLPASIPGVNLSELNIAFSVQMDSGNLKVMLRVEEGSGPAEREVLVLDFDFAQVGPDLRMGNLATYLDRAHAQTKRVFTDLIADKYWPVIRGELT